MWWVPLSIFNLMTTQESAQLLLVRVTTEGPSYQLPNTRLLPYNVRVEDRTPMLLGRQIVQFRRRSEPT